LFSSKLRKAYSLPASSSLSTAIDSLIKKGIVTKQDKQYRILNPVFKAWLHTLS